MRVERMLANILTGGVFLVPFVPLLIANIDAFPHLISNLFFPYITAKNIVFRVLVEILTAGWLILIILDKRYLPKKSLVAYAVSAFLAVMSLATVFSIDPYRSFWSNFERMEGLVTYLHLYLLFVLLGSLLQSEKLWKWFFHVSIGVSVVMSAIALSQLLGYAPIVQSSERLEATFGNATYLAVYLLFHIFLAAYYLFQNKHLGTSIKIIYAGIILFESVILAFTETRGAIVGLAAGVLVIAALNAYANRGRARKIAVGVLVGILALAALFATIRDTGFVQNQRALRRLANVSVSEIATSRFAIWKMALKGAEERPIFGWGPESFMAVFSKHYDPSLYNQEPWFDRAHNVFLDWLVTGGAVGLLAYLSLFAVSFYYLLGGRTIPQPGWSGLRGRISALISKARADEDFTGRSVLIGLFTAYFVQNFFVFDNIGSYILFFSVLAYLNYLYGVECGLLDRAAAAYQKTVPVLAGVAILVPFLAFVIYTVNVKVFLAAKTLIVAMQPQEGKGVLYNLELFEKVIGYETLGTPEAREQFLQVAAAVAGAQGVSSDVKEQFASKAKAEMVKQHEARPYDSRYPLFLGSFLASTGNVDEALIYLNRAHELSPHKQLIFFEIASIYARKGDYEEALRYAKEAYDLEPAFPEARKIYALLAIYTGNVPLADEIIADQKLYTDQRFVNAFLSQGRADRVVEAWKSLVAENPNDTQNHISLAAAYLANGERSRAVKELETAIALDPAFREQGEYLIGEIKAGRNPSAQ